MGGPEDRETLKGTLSRKLEVAAGEGKLPEGKTD